MKIILYSTGCPKCNVLKLKLKQMQLQFELIEDKDKAVDFGNAHNIESAPILVVDNDIYDFNGAIKFLKEINK